MSTSDNRDHAAVFWVVIGFLVLVALILAAGAGATIRLGPSASNPLLWIVAIAFSFVAAVAVFFLFQNSIASVGGSWHGISFRTTGPVAAFLIVFAGIWYFRPQPAFRDLQVLLECDGKQVDEEFTITPVIADHQTGPIRSQNFQATLRMAGHTKSIESVVVVCPGFALADSGPYKCADPILRIKVIKNETAPHQPAAWPNPLGVFREIPSRDTVIAKPPIPPEECELRVRNLTNQSLVLFVLDCTRYYEILDGVQPGGIPWQKIPFPSSKVFSSFYPRDTTGWYCFAVCTKDGQYVALTPVAQMNLCNHRVNTLSVTLRSTEFAADWGFDQSAEADRGIEIK